MQSNESKKSLILQALPLKMDMAFTKDKLSLSLDTNILIQKLPLVRLWHKNTDVILAIPHEVIVELDKLKKRSFGVTKNKVAAASEWLAKKTKAPSSLSRILWCKKKYRDPNFAVSTSDDKIISSTLFVRTNFKFQHVVLVTDDKNMWNVARSSQLTSLSSGKTADYILEWRKDKLKQGSGYGERPVSASMSSPAVVQRSEVVPGFSLTALVETDVTSTEESLTKALEEVREEARRCFKKIFEKIDEVEKKYANK